MDGDAGPVCTAGAAAAAFDGADAGVPGSGPDAVEPGFAATPSNRGPAAWLSADT